MTTEYRMVGAHPFEVAQGDKTVMLAPGEFIELEDDDIKLESNKNLMDLGILINSENATKVRGRSNEKETES